MSKEFYENVKQFLNRHRECKKKQHIIQEGLYTYIVIECLDCQEYYYLDYLHVFKLEDILKNKLK